MRDDTRKRTARHALDDGIARLALLALSERDVQRLLELAVVCIGEVLAVEHAQIFELLPDGRTLISRASLSRERRALSRLKTGHPTASQASFTLSTGSPVISSDLSAELRFRASRAQRALGLVTAVSVPLHGRSARPYGVVEIGTSGGLAVLPEDAVDFLLAAGNLLVPAVERARVEAACRFLAESQSRLVSALDFQESVAALAEMAVPRLADWCCIDVVLPSGVIECVAVAHSDPDVTPVATRLRASLPPDPAADVGVAHVISTGIPEFHFDLGAALSLPPAQELLDDLVEAAGFRAAIVAPLAARGHIFGAVTLVAQSPRRLFDEGDVVIADAFATHAGLALDNVRLFFGKDREAPALPRLAGVTGGIARLDSEILWTRLLGTVGEERDRLARMVESVVQASRLSSASLDPGTGTCDAVDVVGKAVESIRGFLPPKWTLELEQPSVHTVGDAEAIRRIVTALIENAIAYSPDGGSIRVLLETEGATLRLTVEDTGIGIPPEEHDAVFEKFHRGSGARSVAADGAGLGLYICRELASRLNGSIEVAANSDRGTTVVVDLPLAGRSSNPVEALALVPERRGRARRRPTSPP